MMMATTLLAVPLALFLQTTPGEAPRARQTAVQAALNEELWNAARDGDLGRVTRALDRGAEINSGNRYNATALFFAADKGHVEIIRVLLDRGADINAQDTFYKFRPIMMAVMNDHTDAAILMLQRGSEGAGPVLAQAAAAGTRPLVEAALGAKNLTRADVQAALVAARRGKHVEIAGAIEEKLAEFPADPVVTVDRTTLQAYAGTYRNDNATVAVALTGDQLTLTPQGQPTFTLVPTSQETFNLLEAPGLSIAFAGRGGTVERLVVTMAT